jgi:hypothetical protein
LGSHERPNAGLRHLVPEAAVALPSDRDPVETDRTSWLTARAH